MDTSFHTSTTPARRDGTAPKPVLTTLTFHTRFQRARALAASLDKGGVIPELRKEIMDEFFKNETAKNLGVVFKME